MSENKDKPKCCFCGGTDGAMEQEPETGIFMHELRISCGYFFKEKIANLEKELADLKFKDAVFAQNARLKAENAEQRGKIIWMEHDMTKLQNMNAELRKAMRTKR